MTPGDILVGRREESRRLDELLDGIAERGAAVLVRGEPGIGKSVLLATGARAAAGRGLRVLSAVGVESQPQLPFAGLRALLEPVLAGVADLPAPQRDALRCALGEPVAEGGPDLFLTALATLDLLAEAAAGTPVLLLVEDAQWLDRASADVLAFVARRLEAEPVVLLAAIRDGFDTPFDAAGLAELRLERLDAAAAGELLDARAPGLRPGLRRRLLLEAAGNPLALVELPLAPVPAGAGAFPAAWLPLTARLEQAFGARVAALPAVTRTLLLVAALNDTDLLAEILAAGRLVAGRRCGPEDLGPAVAACLADIEPGGGRLHLRHPLMRSALRQRAGDAERSAVHAALVDVLAGQPNRQVWHRAAATPGPDEGIAADLDAAADRAYRQGAVVAAVAALQRAAELSLDVRAGIARRIRAAEIAFELGRQDLVDRLLDEVEPATLSTAERARLAWVRGGFREHAQEGRQGVRSLIGFAHSVLADGDTDLALMLLGAAGTAAFWNDPGPDVRGDVVEVAERMPIDPADARLVGILAYTAPIDRGAAVIDNLWLWAPDAGGDPLAARLLGNAAAAVGAFDLSLQFATAALGPLRAQGRLGFVARALITQANAAVQLANLGVAIPAAEEAGRRADETAQPHLAALAQATEAKIAALRGEPDRLERLAGAAERDSMAASLSVVVHARGLAALADGRPADAYDALARLFDPADPAHHVMHGCAAIGDLAEAAARSGQAEAVAGVMATMERRARLTPAESLHNGLRHARAVLAGDDVAEQRYEEALRADVPGWPFVRARALLAYGEWLRRQRRVAESRTRLRTARELFDALGTNAWSDRARQELRASGESSRSRTPAARDQLTPQELQIVQLAAEGLTNREIGQRLYLSHRTVSTVLHRVFPKLGVTSRSDLSRLELR
ncbi:AAA family ATPase [Dactylosporangium sp. CA-139114]|uniref:helix-turn-helix transcriptional regulator n=1 Tax=Dactylosporangium sp. CA-139114 TaxID=3239931 RepID=UPI003D998257